MVRRVSPLPADEAATIKKTLFTSGWPAEVTIPQIEALFGEYGKVVCVRMKKKNKVQKDTIFVELETEEQAKVIENKGTLKFNDKDISIMSKDKWFTNRKNSIAEQKAKKKGESKEEVEKEKSEEDSKKRKMEDNEEKSEKKAKISDNNNEIEYEKGLIIEIKEFGAIDSKFDMKAILEKMCPIKFIELQKEEQICFIRMESADQAQKIITEIPSQKIEIGGKVPVARLLEGDEEKNYWQKIYKYKLEKAKKSKKTKNKRGKRKRF